jgi:murein DD-endopeptidase MepM/ murein hydrolase activator NlpD
MEVDLPAALADPGRLLEHEVAYVRDGGDVTIRAGPVPVSAEEPVRLDPPVSGGPWVAAYHASWPRGHRRVLYEVDGRSRIPGRFAIDWILADAEGRTASGDADVVANWLGYGAAVLAVADAVVAAARDDVPESARLSTHPDHPLEDAAGNYIALDLGGGRFAFYEHLRPGSVRVSVGERVRRGQPIAALGFTGHSSGPHLHFHVADASSSLGAEGMPYVFDCFDVRGAYDDLGALGVRPWRPRAPGVPVRRRGERPAPNAVVEFGCPTVRRGASTP